MAVPVIATWNVGDTGGATATSVTITKPTGVAVGDLLVLIVATDFSNGTDLNAVSGWNWPININAAVSDAELAVYWRIADGTEGASISVTCNTKVEMLGWYLRITGAHATAPFDAQGIAQHVVLSTINIPQVTTTVNDCLAFYALAFDGGDGSPFSISGTGWSEFDEHNSGTAGTDVCAVFGTKSMPTLGGAGVATVGASVIDGSSSIQFSIAPVGGLSKLVSGSITSTGALKRLPWHLLAGSITITGALLAGLKKLLLLSGSIIITGTVFKHIVLGTAYVGSITASGTVSALFLLTKAISGSITATGTLIRSIGYNVSGVITASSTLLRAITKKVVGSIAASGIVNKAIALVAKTGSITISGTLSLTLTLKKLLTGAITIAGALATLFIPEGPGPVATRYRSAAMWIKKRKRGR